MAEQTVPVSGGASHWALQAVSRERFCSLLTKLGYGSMAPPERRPNTCLREAMEALKRKGQIVQALKDPGKNGYECVTVEKCETSNVYDQDYRAWLGDTGNVHCTSWARAGELTAKYNELRQVVTGSTAGQVLVDIAKNLQATMLWPGTYWIPEHSLDAWKSVMGGIAEINQDNRIHLIYVEKCSLDTIQAVRDALVNEFYHGVEALRKELSDETKAFGEEALDNRKFALAAMRNKLVRYQAIVGDWQGWFDEKLQEADEAITVASLRSMQIV